MAAKGIRTWARAKFGIQQRFSSLLEWCLRKKLRIALALAAAIAAFFLFSLLKGVFLVALFIVAGAASLLYNRFIRTSLGIELITLAIVLTGRLYGPGAAIFSGFTALLLAELATESLQHKTIVSFTGIFVIGFLTQFFSGASIMLEGIALTLVYDAIIMPGYLILGSNPARCILFLVTHIAFNIWLFTTVAPLIAGILI
ncbi:hypothetical protein HYV82_05150 [Candidatus Woesearchaeota archaeon]|nr:hypothetical protein [Candidatus Woesearchaeota archaeon]